jgi:Glycosyltransferase WbsX
VGAGAARRVTRAARRRSTAGDAGSRRRGQRDQALDLPVDRLGQGEGIELIPERDPRCDRRRIGRGAPLEAIERRAGRVVAPPEPGPDALLAHELDGGQGPFEEVLATGKPDFPFCICWANETWTRRWDGAEQEVLMPQVHSDGLDARFIRELIPAFRDSRYIRVRGRPLLVIYRATQLSDAARTIAIWAQECRAAGLPPPFVLAALTFDVRDPGPLGCDGALEFPPHHVRARLVTDELSLLDKQYAGYVFDYAAAARWYLERPEPGYPLFRTVMTGWDNTPRRPQHSNVFLGSTPVRYGEWLTDAIRRARQRYPPGDRLVFINAWNEWAEGAHLEPDHRFGRAYLEATRVALTSAVSADPRPYGLASPTAAALRGETVALQRLDELLTREELEIRCHMTFHAERGADALHDELRAIQGARAIAIRTLEEESQRALEDEKNRVGYKRAPDIGPVALALADRVIRGLDRVPAIKAMLRGAFRKLLRPPPPRV